MLKFLIPYFKNENHKQKKYIYSIDIDVNPLSKIKKINFSNIEMPLILRPTYLSFDSLLNTRSLARVTIACSLVCKVKISENHHHSHAQIPHRLSSTVFLTPKLGPDTRIPFIAHLCGSQVFLQSYPYSTKP